MSAVTLRFRFFAGAAQAVGAEYLQTLVAPDASVGEAFEQVMRQAASGREEQRERLEKLTAVSTLVSGGEILTSRDLPVARLAVAEIEVLPPFAGG